MTERRSGKKEKPPEVWRIAGRAAVGALFRRDPEAVLRLFYVDGLKTELGDHCRTMARLKRPYRLVGAEELARVAGTAHHGGVIAVTPQRPIPLLGPAEARKIAQAGEHLFLLDGIGNPHNLGAIARSLAFFGFRHLAISDHPEQAGLSDAAFRIAEGGLDCLELYRLPDCAKTLQALKSDFLVAGTALSVDGIPLAELPRTRPILMALGNEESGLPPATRESCEILVTLRGTGQIQSLNVAATAAIIAHGLARKSQAG